MAIAGTYFLYNLFFGGKKLRPYLLCPSAKEEARMNSLQGLSEDGAFLIRSAYKAALNLKKESTGKVSEPGANNVWKSIWSLNILVKVKNFLWCLNTKILYPLTAIYMAKRS